MIFFVVTFTAVASTLPSHNCDGACAHTKNITGAACPFDNTNGTWTGRTRTVNAKIWYIMRCTQGHEYLAESP